MMEGHIFQMEYTDDELGWYWMLSKKVSSKTVHGPYISRKTAENAMERARLNFLAKKWKIEAALKKLKARA